MSLSKDIARVSRYRDDIVTHGETRAAMARVIKAAEAEYEVARLRDGIEKIIADRWAGNFDALIPKMRALLDEDPE
jgi:hypothetical protein